MFKKLVSSAILVCASLSAPAFANLVYSTGTDVNKDGRDDAMTLGGLAAYLVTTAPPGWPTVVKTSPTTTAKYISFAANQYPSTTSATATYVYGFQFDWTDLAGLTTIDFNFLSDDYLTDVTLNGVSLKVTNTGKPTPWGVATSKTVSAAAIAGVNKLEFLVNNLGAGASGLAANFTVHGNAATVLTAGQAVVPNQAVPEPATFMMVGLGLALMAGRRRRS